MKKHQLLKKLIFSLLLVFAIQSLQAQNYKPILGDTTNKWYGLFIAYCDFYHAGVVEETNRTMTVDSIEYTILQVGGQLSYMDSFLVREDTLKGEAYMYDLSDSTEFKFYDMSLELGDSMTFIRHEWMNNTFFTAEVIDIDTVDERKVISFSEEIFSCIEGVSPPIRFVEGIGTNALFADNRIIMTCKEVDDENVYINEFGLLCGDRVSTNEAEIIETPIQLFPNPTGDQVQIQLDNNALVDAIQVFDATGRLVHTVSGINQENYQLSFADFTAASGVFFLKITVDGKIYSKRIIRHSQ